MERHETFLTEDLMKHYLRTILDSLSYRVFAVVDPYKTIIIDHCENKICKHPNHPLNENFGHHNTILEKELYIDKTDFRDKDNQTFFRMAPGKTVRLKYSDFVEYVNHNNDQLIVKNTIPQNPKKIKGIIHWVPINDSVDCKFEMYDSLLKNNEFNEQSKKVKYGKIEKIVLYLLDKTLQFERIGFFRFDRMENDIPVFIQIIDLTDKYNKN